MLIMSMTFSIQCNAQEVSSDNHQWIQGEWQNAVLGDIIDIYPDGLKFQKNAFHPDGDEYSDYEPPKDIDEARGLMLYGEKTPYQFGYHRDSLTGENFLAIIFEHEVENDWTETAPFYMGIDEEHQLLFYISNDGEKVCLNKYSDLTFDEQLNKELKDKQEQLPAEIASGNFDWMHGQWICDGMFYEVVNIDSDSVVIESGFRNEEDGSIDIDQRRAYPINLYYELRELSSKVELVLVEDNLFVDKDAQGIYTYYDFTELMGFDHISEHTQKEQEVIAQQKLEQQIKREKEWHRTLVRNQIKRIARLTILCIAALALLFFLVRWFIRKVYPKLKEATIKAKAKAVEAKAAAEKLRAEHAKPEEHLGIGKIILVSLLVLLLLDLKIGIILLLLSLVLLIIRLINKNLASRIIDFFSGLIKKMNKRPEIWLIVGGIVVLREFNAIIGIVMLIMGCFYLFSKESKPAKKAFYSKTERICRDAKSNLSYATFWLLALVAFLILNYFFARILAYLSIVLLIVFIINFVSPSTFKNPKAKLSNLYKNMVQPKFFETTGQMLKSKKKIIAYLIVGILVVMNAQQISMAKAIPYMFTDDTKVEVNSVNAKPSPKTVKADSGKSDVELAKAELHELEIYRNRLFSDMAFTFDPAERAWMGDQLKAIDARERYLQDFLLKKTGFPY